MDQAAEELLRQLKPKHRRLTETGQTAPEPDTKQNAKAAAKPKASE